MLLVLKVTVRERNLFHRHVYCATQEKHLMQYTQITRPHNHFKAIQKTVRHCEIFSCGNIKTFIVSLQFFVSCTQQPIRCYIYNEILKRSNEYPTRSFKQLTAVECTFMTDDTSQSWAQLNWWKRESSGRQNGKQNDYFKLKNYFITKQFLNYLDK